MKSLRLNVFLAHAGLCSRRRANELIKNGEITINHSVVKDTGYQLNEEKDTVRYKKQVVKMGAIKPITIALNKPTNIITTVADEKNRPTIMHLLGRHIKTRVYPIGRLDRNTTGIILLTNDGELAQKLSHPKYENKKIYQVTLSKDLSDEYLKKIKDGLYLKDGSIKVDNIFRSVQKRNVRVTLHSGKNRIVRRIFESLGYTVRKLNRVSFAGITTKNLVQGQYRILSKKEVDFLKK